MACFELLPLWENMAVRYPFQCTFKAGAETAGVLKSDCMTRIRSNLTVFLLANLKHAHATRLGKHGASHTNVTGYLLRLSSEEATHHHT